MKKFILTFIMTFCLSVITNGQTINTFVSEQFNNDYNTLVEIANNYKGKNKIWATKLNEQFPLNENGVIKLSYTIDSNDYIDFDKCMDVTTNWFTYAFNSENSIKKYETEGIIYGEGKYINISQYNINAIYYAKSVSIHADTEIGIKINDKSINIVVYIKHYNIISGDSLLKSENSILLIKDSYPNIESDNKIAYAIAFINCYAQSFEKVKNYIEFLNTNMNKTHSEIDFMW